MSYNLYNDIVHVQKSLKVFCNVSNEVFLSHKTETLLIFQKLWTFMKNDDDTWTSSLTNNQSSCSFSLKDHNFSSALMIMNKSFLPAFAFQSSSTSSLNDSNSFFTLSNIINTFSLTLHSQSSTTFFIQQFFSSLSLSDHKLFSLTSQVLILTQALNKDSTEIQKFLSRSEFEAIENELEWIVENSCVVDLQLDESQSTSKIRFQKSLSQQFLTIEYT